MSPHAHVWSFGLTLFMPICLKGIVPPSWLALWPDEAGFTWADSVVLQTTSVLQEGVLYGPCALSQLYFLCTSKKGKGNKAEKGRHFWLPGLESSDNTV